MLKDSRRENNTGCDQIETVYLASPLGLDVPLVAEIWYKLLNEGMNVVYGARGVVDE